jgi:predicted RNA-binding protein with PIN domain
MEPGEPGSGLAFEADCSTDMLSLNWQRLIMTHLAEREHKGVLTGSAITDMKITLKSGKAHLKHTEGGDFRQATYRAVRQGLMQAENILLEPFYSFTIELPRDAVGHAMTDIDRMCGTCVYDGENTITGRAPVSEMQNYQKELSAYTRGLGRIMCTFDGYYPCHNADEVIGAVGYFPDEDLRNPSSSVFCAHGAGFAVPWNEVKRYMHLESCLDTSAVDEYGGAWDEELMGYAGRGNVRQSSDMHDGRKSEEIWLGTDEIDEILNRTYNANRKGAGEASRNTWKLRRGNISAESGAGTVKVRDYSQIDNSKPAYLLVDGYNVIFAWKELSELAESNIDGARGRLLDIMSNYRGMAGCEVIVVFDAYRVQGHKTEIFDYHNIHVVFTREAETADQYIEKFAHENAKKYRVTVATSDGLEQIIIRGAGCLLISARELEAEVMRQNRQIAEEYLIQSPGAKSYMSDVMEDVLKKLNDEENES